MISFALRQFSRFSVSPSYRLLTKLYRTGSSFALRLVRNSVFPQYGAAVIAGREKHSGELLYTLYIGAGRNREFLINRLFAEAETVKQRDAVHPIAGRLWGPEAEVGADLMMVDLDLPYSLLYSGRDYLRVPQWVRQKLVLPPSKQAFVDGLPRKLRREVFRCIRKYGYSYDLVGMEEAFRTFYHKLYAPYIRTRFNNESVVVDEVFFLSECRLGFLLRLLSDGEPVGGVVLQPMGAQLSSVWAGFSAGGAATGATGASDVLDYFTIEHAFDGGYRVIDFGGSRPLLDDGVFRYKRKWGTGVYGSRLPAGDILLRPLKSSAAVGSIMTHNFWITRDRGRLGGQLMIEGRSLGTEALEQIARNCGRGIETIKLKSLSGFNDAVREAAERMPGICLIDLSGSREPVRDLVRR